MKNEQKAFGAQVGMLESRLFPFRTFQNPGFVIVLGSDEIASIKFAERPRQPHGFHAGFPQPGEGPHATSRTLTGAGIWANASARRSVTMLSKPRAETA